MLSRTFQQQRSGSLSAPTPHGAFCVTTPQQQQQQQQQKDVVGSGGGRRGGSVCPPSSASAGAPSWGDSTPNDNTTTYGSAHLGCGQQQRNDHHHSLIEVVDASSSALPATLSPALPPSSTSTSTAPRRRQRRGAALGDGKDSANSGDGCVGRFCGAVMALTCVRRLLTAAGLRHRLLVPYRPSKGKGKGNSWTSFFLCGCGESSVCVGSGGDRYRSSDSHSSPLCSVRSAASPPLLFIALLIIVFLALLSTVATIGGVGGGDRGVTINSRPSSYASAGDNDNDDDGDNESDSVVRGLSYQQSMAAVKAFVGAVYSALPSVSYMFADNRLRHLRREESRGSDNVVRHIIDLISLLRVPETGILTASPREGSARNGADGGPTNGEASPLAPLPPLEGPTRPFLAGRVTVALAPWGAAASVASAAVEEGSGTNAEGGSAAAGGFMDFAVVCEADVADRVEATLARPTAASEAFLSRFFCAVDNQSMHITPTAANAAAKFLLMRPRFVPMGAGVASSLLRFNREEKEALSSSHRHRLSSLGAAAEALQAATADLSGANANANQQKQQFNKPASPWSSPPQWVASSVVVVSRTTAFLSSSDGAGDDGDSGATDTGLTWAGELALLAAINAAGRNSPRHRPSFAATSGHARTAEWYNLILPRRHEERPRSSPWPPAATPLLSLAPSASFPLSAAEGWGGTDDYYADDARRGGAGAHLPQWAGGRVLFSPHKSASATKHSSTNVAQPNNANNKFFFSSVPSLLLTAHNRLGAFYAVSGGGADPSAEYVLGPDDEDDGYGIGGGIVYDPTAYFAARSRAKAKARAKKDYALGSDEAAAAAVAVAARNAVRPRQVLSPP